jgi:hypothetical protein
MVMLTPSVEIRPDEHACCRWLLVVDNEPIRRELESELQRVRETVESCEQKINRHEAIDLPAFRQWMAIHCADLLDERKLVEERISTLRVRLGTIRGLAQYGVRNEAEAFFWLKEIESGVASIPPFVRRAWEEVNIGRPQGRPRARRHDSGWRDEREDEEVEIGCEYEIPDAIAIDPENWERDRDPVAAGRRERCKRAYRAIARILHPDAAGLLSKRELELWYQAQHAYEAEDLVELESILAQCGRPGTRQLLLSELRQMVAQGNERVAVLRSTIEELSQLASWRFVLLSPQEVKERLRRVRREFTEAIRQLMGDLQLMEVEYERVRFKARRWMEKRRAGENRQLLLEFAE